MSGVSGGAVGLCLEVNYLEKNASKASTQAIPLVWDLQSGSETHRNVLYLQEGKGGTAVRHIMNGCTRVKE